METVRALEILARRLRVSKSEALRRAIRRAMKEAESAGNDSLAALEELQGSLGLTASKASSWERALRVERRASSERLTAS